MNVSLTLELEQMVAEKVQSGLYISASEVVREALRLLKERDELNELRLEDLRREIGRGLEELESGQGQSFDSPRQLGETIKARGSDAFAANSPNSGKTG